MKLLSLSEPLFKKYSIKKNDNNILNSNIERLNMNENVKTKNWLNNFFEIIKELEIIYSDGFQIKDTFATLALTPKILNIAMNYNDVKLEFANLSNTQIADLTTEFTKIGIDIFYTNNNSDNELLGIDNLNELISELFNITLSTIAAAKDGININDIVYLIPITSSLTKIVMIGSSAFNEAKHLSSLKVSSIVGLILGKLLFHIRK